MIEINVHLFGKPEWMLDLDKSKPEDFKGLGNYLQEWLHRVSEIAYKLENNGWNRSGRLYDIMFFKEIDKKCALQELKGLEIKQKEVSIIEWEDEGYD